MDKMKNKNILTLMMGLIFLVLTIHMISSLRLSSGGAQTSFYTGSNVVCSINNGNPYWFENGNQNNATGDCYRSNGIDQNGFPTTGCCAAGYFCSGTGTGSLCQPHTVDASQCSQYKTADECNSGSITDSIKTSIETSAHLLNGNGNVINFCHNYYVDTIKCVYYGGCGCYWDSTSNVCKSTYVSGNPCDPNNPNERSCQISTSNVVNKCSSSNPTISLTWDARIVDSSGNTSVGNESWCMTGSRDFPCPTKSNLPFFGLFNFVLSGLIIGIVYFFLRRK